MLNFYKKDPNVKIIFDLAAEANAEIWIVGGAIRDYFINSEIKDIDFAIDIDINNFYQKIKERKIKIITKDINYKTISLILGKKTYQVTSLRNDKVFFGRQAKVEFTDKIHIDANRRDFSINAIYLNSSGELFDPFNGLKDIKNKKLRFIGNPKTRIEEDYLRIIRFCRFCSFFPEKPISQLLQKQIKKQLNNINLLSNKRMKDEFTKILDNSNFDVSLSIIKKLTLDRYILLKKFQYNQTMDHCGFKTNDFKIIKFIKTFGAYTLCQSRLSLITVIFPHLYDFKKFNNISLRFELCKKSKKYFKFLKLIETISYRIEPISSTKNNDLKIKIEILKIIWSIQNYIYFENTDSFVRKVPISWCRLGLFHILPLSLIKKFDILNVELPLFPITRKDINKIFKIIDYNEVNKLLFKAEEFWINRDFCPSSKELITFLRLN